jgi:hypothetical protein
LPLLKPFVLFYLGLQRASFFDLYPKPTVRSSSVLEVLRLANSLPPFHALSLFKFDLLKKRSCFAQVSLLLFLKYFSSLILRMSSTVNVGATECQTLDEVRFRERFKKAFDLDPDLTTETYYQILLDVDFNEQKSLWKVVDRVRKPNEFLVPDFLLRPVSPSRNPDPFTTPVGKTIPTFEPALSIERSSTLGSNKKRLRRRIEHSDEDLVITNDSSQSTTDRPLLSPFKGTPNILPKFNGFNSFENDTPNTDDEDEDVRPRKKKHRSHTIPIRQSKAPETSPGNQRRSRVSASQGTAHTKPSEASKRTNILGSSGEESGLFVSIPTTGNPQGSKSSIAEPFNVQDSDTLLSDADDDEQDNTSSEVSDDFASPRYKQSGQVKRTKVPRGNQNEMVLKHRVKTKATPWLHMLVNSRTSRPPEECSNCVRPVHFSRQH